MTATTGNAERLTPSRIEALTQHAVDHGAQATRTTNGVLLRLPNQDTVSIHYTSSDVNAPHQIRRKLQHAGIPWIGEVEAKMKPTKRTRDRVRAAIVKLGDPHSLRIIDVKTTINDAGDDPIEHQAIRNALITLGYVPSGKTSLQRWYRPFKFSLIDPTATTDESGEIIREPEPDVRPVVVLPAGDAPAPTAVDWTRIPPGITVADFVACADALGLTIRIEATRA